MLAPLLITSVWARFPFIYNKNLRNMKLNYLYCLLAFLFMPLCIKAQDV